MLLDSDDMVARARIAGTNSSWVSRRGSDAYGRPEAFRTPNFGLPPEASDHFIFEIEVYAGVSGTSNGSDNELSTATLIWRGTSGPVAVIDSVRDIMSPVQSDTSIGSLMPTLIRAPSGQIQLALWLHGSHLGEPEEGDWALGLHVRIERDREVVGTAEVLYPMIEQGVQANMPTNWVRFDVNWLTGPPDSLDAREWEVVMTASPDIALYDIDRNTYWDGASRFPLMGIELLSEITPRSGGSELR